MAARGQELYTLQNPQGQETTQPVPVLVHAMRGSIDAGHAGSLLVEHLTEKLESTRVASFDLDALMDYRSRRPVMTYEDGAWTDYDQPELVVDLLRDDNGQQLLLLHGSEPDLRWEGFIKAVRELIDWFGVELTVGVHGIPMGVPHTRPITVTAHGTRPEMVEDYPNYISSVRVPGSAAALMELRLGHSGHDAMGFAAHVPHYLAQSDYPKAAAELLRQISKVTGLQLPVGDLEADGTRMEAEIDRQVEASDEVRSVVKALEEQFDSLAEATGDDALGGTSAEPEDVPSADEIAARFSEYLAGRDGTND